MKNIKNFIVLLFVLFTIPTIAQTTYTIGPGCNSTPHFDVKRTTQTSADGFVDETTTTIGHKNTLNQIIELISDDVNENSYSNYSLVFNGNLNFSGQSLITLTPTLTTINGTLTVGDVNIGSITVNGTLNANSLTINTGKTLTVNGNVYTNTLTNNGTISVNDYKILKVNVTYADNGTEDFDANAIVIGINRTFDLDLALTGGFWNLIGFPNNDGIATLAALYDADGTPIPDIWALAFDYSNNNWSNTYLTSDGEGTKRGKGFLAFPNVPEYTTHNIDLNITSENEDLLSFSYEGTAGSDGTRWFALANPFTQKIAAEKFLSKNTLQGQGVYVDNGDSYSYQEAGVIKPLQGFFVNMASGHTTIDFKLDEIFYALQSKSETTTNNEIVLDVVTGEHAVALSFAENEAALTEYDIFDADKMFGTGAVAEPYFTLGEKTLCHQVVNTLPYVAPMNIRSGEARDIKIVASDIPEQYEVILKDGEEEIALEQGSIYETLVSNGENADRFKVIINKKNGVSISDVENVSETSISQYNRNIIIEGGNNIHTEIFNMLGQKVYETSSRNFTLNNANAGTYVVKVKDGNSVNTTKIVIK
jgi:hypothetical protein